MRRIITAISITLAVVAIGAPATAQQSPPFRGPATLGHTYQSDEKQHIESCPDMLAFYGHCFYHPYPAVDFMLDPWTPIQATADGTVAIVGQETEDNPDAWPRRPGRFILLELAVPVGECRFMAFKHLRDWAVAEGDVVTRNQIIGYSGQSQAAGNPHLHMDCFTSAEGFNTYAAQADYGPILWCEGGVPMEGTVATFTKGDAVVFRAPERCR